jgi:hypothetical protein
MLSFTNAGLSVLANMTRSRKRARKSAAGVISSAVATMEFLETRTLFSEASILENSVAKFSTPVSTAMGTGVGPAYAVVAVNGSAKGYSEILVASANGTNGYVTVLDDPSGNQAGTLVFEGTFNDGLGGGTGDEGDLTFSNYGADIYVTSNSAPGTVAWLQSNGIGSFTLRQDFSASGALSFDSLGFDPSDAGVPVLFAGETNGGLAYFKVLGTTFTYEGVLTTGSDAAVTTLLVGDVNGDGFPDVVGFNLKGPAFELLSATNGTLSTTAQTLTSSLTGTGAEIIAIGMGDLNGDGKQDLVAVTVSGALVTWLGSTTGLTGSQVENGEFAAPNSGALSVGDLNGDGLPDIVFTYYAPTNSKYYSRVLLGEGNGLAVDIGGFYTSNARLPIIFGDENGDGRVDLIDTSYNAGTGATTCNVEFDDTTTEPTFTSNYSAIFLDGQFNTFQVTTVSYPIGATLGEIGALPSGVTFDVNTGRLSGMPTDSSTGTYTLTFTANVIGSHVVDHQVDQTFYLYVDQLPSLSGPTSATFEVGFPGNYEITATGLPLPVISLDGTLPPGLNFFSADGTATVSGTLSAGSQGVYTEIFVATSQVGTTEEEVTFTVNPAPFSGLYVGTVGTATTYVSNTFATPKLSESGKLPKGVKFIDEGGGIAAFAGMPAPNTGGGYTLTLTAKSTGHSEKETFVLLIEQPSAFVSSKGKVITNGSATFTSGTYNDFTLLTSGYPAPVLSDTVVSLSGKLPDGVVFDDHGNGSASLFGSPMVGTGGIYTLTFTANNSIGSTPGTESFVLTVDDVPQFISANHATFQAGEVNVFDIDTVGFPDVQISETGVLPAGLTFADGTTVTGTDITTAYLVGTPEATGVYFLTFIAKNKNVTIKQTFTLTIGP